MSDAVLQPLRQAMAKALQSEALQKKYLGQAVFVSNRNADEFREVIRRDTERTREIARIAKISLD
jgi:tripartite-type tricarboxylate transporter receptor subunit TctC